MARVEVGKVGEVLETVEATTVREAVQKYGLEGDFVVQVMGKTATMDTVVKDGDFISIGEKIKGGR